MISHGIKIPEPEPLRIEWNVMSRVLNIATMWIRLEIDHVHGDS